MAERRSTGGTKEFHYRKEDLDRIRTTDTDSTKAFKESYKQWQVKLAEERELDKLLRRQRTRLLLIAIALVLAACLLIATMFWK